MLHSFIVKLAMRTLICIQLCMAAPVNTDILPSLQALHLDTSPPAMHQVPSRQQNDSQTNPGGSIVGIPNQPQGTPSSCININAC